MQSTDTSSAAAAHVDPDASALERLLAEVEHAHQVIAWLLTSLRSPNTAPSIAIPYRVLDDLARSSVLVRRHTDNNDTVHYELLERAEIVPLRAEHHAAVVPTA